MGAGLSQNSLYRGSLYQGLSVVCIYNYTSCHFGVANFLQGDRLHLFKFGVTRQVSDFINKKKKLSLREENLKKSCRGLYYLCCYMASSFIRATTTYVLFLSLQYRCWKSLRHVLTCNQKPTWGLTFKILTKFDMVYSWQFYYECWLPGLVQITDYFYFFLVKFWLILGCVSSTFLFPKTKSSSALLDGTKYFDVGVCTIEYWKIIGLQQSSPLAAKPTANMRR